MLVAPGLTLIGNVRFDLDGNQLKAFHSTQVVPKTAYFPHPHPQLHYQLSEPRQSHDEGREPLQRTFETVGDANRNGHT